MLEIVKMKIFAHIKAAVRRYLCRDLIVPVKAVLRLLIKTFFFDRKGGGRTDTGALSSPTIVVNISGLSPSSSCGEFGEMSELLYSMPMKLQSATKFFTGTILFIALFTLLPVNI